jgi:histone-lysine N-methyltransferase SETMAR
MATVSWDRKGMLVVELMQQGIRNILRNTERLRRAIQNKRCEMLTSNVVLLQQNSCPHTAAGNRERLEHFNWELFDHPPYSPVVALSNYHPFTYPKYWLQSQCFNNNEELMESVKTWLRSQVADFFDTGIQKLIPRYKYLRSSRDYVEK